MNESNGAGPPSRGTLGTFAGVFTPSILTILGIILFLRLGYVVGSAGLLRALAIILLANAISILTSISLSAIATNLRVRGGGDYYVISRTLGVEYGGALGIVLFLAQSVSISFYAIGFGEVVASLLGPDVVWLPQAIAAGAVAALFVLAWLGADWATRFQFAIMIVLFAALVAFFAGGLPAWDGGQFQDNLAPAGQLPFWAVFAIFFPAVTGFTQGVSMSGDLRDPGRSIPQGTFAAVGLSLVVYVVVAVIFAGVMPGQELVADYGAMRRVSRFAWLIDAGVIAATLSSALASFLGAPRILQSLASDRVFPILNAFAVGHGPADNPRRGVLLSAGIALATVSLGELNLIAPVVSMFFLISYGLLNYATWFEARANSPSFRPRFRFFHARLSLAGGVGCLGAMLAIHPAAGAVAVVVLFAVYQYVSRSVNVERWADSARSHRLQRVREDLHAISADLAHSRDWRPVIMVFSEDPGRRQRMLRFASWIEGGSGFTTVVRLLKGEGPDARRRRRDAEQELRAEIEQHKIPAFSKAVVTDDMEDALPVLLQSHGLGQVRVNSVLLNWYDRLPEGEGAPGLRSYVRYLRMALRYGSNVLILATRSKDLEVVEATPSAQRCIDVWYRDNASGRLMLLLAYLMTRSPTWESAKLRVFLPIPQDHDAEASRQAMTQMLEDVRIDAEPEVVEEPDCLEVVRQSGSSSVVFLPFRLDDEGPAGVLPGQLDELVEALGVTALVLATEEIALDSDPEEGRHGEIAQAMDAAAKAQRIARKVERTALQAEEALNEARAKIEAARESGAAADELERLEQAARGAEGRAEQTRRRAAKGRVKAEQAADEASAALGQPTEETEGEAEADENP